MSGREANRRREDGAVAIVAGISATLLFLIAAMVVDLGLARDWRRISQNAADASALAAVNKLYPTVGTCSLLNPNGTTTSPCYADAAKAAKDYAKVNYGTSDATWSSCSDTRHYYVPAGYSQCISFTDATEIKTAPATPSKVRVLMPVRRLKTGLGNIAGVSEVDVRTVARATLDTSGVLPCGICVLGAGTHNIGNGDLSAVGASVYLNGSLSAGPNGNVTAAPAGQTISVQGTAPGGCCTPTPTTGAPQLPDPLLGVLTFPLPGTSTAAMHTAPCTQGPGKYGAVSLPNSTCTLAAGLYVITGHWDLKNNTVLQGTGVTLYFTCGTAGAPAVCSNQPGGWLEVKNGNVNLSAPTTGPLAGLVIAYDRTNTAGLNMQGNGSAMFTGTIYAPSSTLSFPGNSCAVAFNSAVIVGDVASNGNTACVKVSYAANQNVKLPPSNAALDR